MPNAALSRRWVDITAGALHDRSMGKVTIAMLLTSTVLVLVAFTKGINIIHGSPDVMSHLYWAVAAVMGTLAANVFAMFHAAQSDRLIRQLRQTLQAAGIAAPGEGEAMR